MRHRDGIDFLPIDSGPRHGFGHDDGQRADMFARGDFGHHAAKGPMARNLAVDDGRQHLAAIAYHGGGGFVAGRFNAQQNHE